MKKIHLGIVGIGQRGCAYLKMISEHPDCELTAICDINCERMTEFTQKCGISAVPAMYTDLDTMLDSARLDALVICLPDYLHEKAALAAIRRDIHIILEKPMALTGDGCDAIIQAIKEHPVIVQIGFVLRETVFFQKAREIVSSGRLGQLMSIQSDESLQVMHGASYMRRWHRKSENCGGFILTKCCHDLDMLNWIADSTPVSVASFGGLDYFKYDPRRPTNCSKCADQSCPYRFQGEYVVMTDTEKVAPVKFDLCVFNNDKDTVDNQTAIISYANGVKASFNLNLFAKVAKRSLKLVGTNAYAEGNTVDNKIRIVYSNDRPDDIIDCSPVNSSGHDGGDESFFNEFIHCIRHNVPPHADFRTARMSTCLGNAIEKSRLEHRIVDL